MTNEIKKAKPIIVNETNIPRIADAIMEAEGRAATRCISPKDIFDAITKIEKKLEVPKTALEGVSFTVDIHAQNFPRAYKYRAESTQFTLTRQGGKWRVSWIERGYTKTEGHTFECTNMPKETEDAIIKTKRCF